MVPVCGRQDAPLGLPRSTRFPPGTISIPRADPFDHTPAIESPGRGQMRSRRSDAHENAPVVPASVGAVHIHEHNRVSFATEVPVARRLFPAQILGHRPVGRLLDMRRDNIERPLRQRVTRERA